MKDATTGGVTQQGFEFKISNHKCTLYIPVTLGIYNAKVQQAFCELWNRLDAFSLQYFNEIKIKK